MTFPDRIKRRATLTGGPMDGRDVPIPLPESMPWPEWTCLTGPGPRPRPWHHYAYTADASYTYAGPCAGIDHHGAQPHEHCEHQWDDESERGHRCELVYGHEGDHACGCCPARTAAAPVTDNDQDDGFGVCGNACGWWLAGTLVVVGLLATCALWAALLWHGRGR